MAWALSIIKWLIANWRETLLGLLITYLVGSNAFYRLDAREWESKYTASQAQVSILADAIKKQNAGILKQGAAEATVKTNVAAATTNNKAAVAGIAKANQKTFSTKVGATCQSAMDLLKDSASQF